jgi:hypothetical protein
MLLIILPLSLAFFGCQGVRFGVERESTEVPPSYKKGGPPPWAPAHDIGLSTDIIITRPHASIMKKNVDPIFITRMGSGGYRFHFHLMFALM